MKAILINHNYDPTWLKDYKNLVPVIYDRSDDGIERDITQYGPVYKTQNTGDVDYDKLSYLVENYDRLPDVFLWGKTNLFKYVDKEYLDEMLSKSDFAPLLKLDHRTYSDQYGPVNYYQGNIYCERADSWFFNAGGVDAKHFQNWEQWCRHFGLPLSGYIPFAPGGNYILTEKKVRKYSKDFYDEMRSFLPHSSRPAEAQCAERSYYMMFHG